MEITIDKKVYELEFGLEYIATLDKIYEQDMQGMKLGFGVQTSIPLIKLQNPTVLVSVIKASTNHLKTKPSNKGINDFLTELAVEDKLEDFFAEIEDNMRIAPFLKSQMKSVDTNVKLMEREIKKKN